MNEKIEVTMENTPDGINLFANVRIGVIHFPDPSLAFSFLKERYDKLSEMTDSWETEDLLIASKRSKTRIEDICG